MLGLTGIIGGVIAVVLFFLVIGTLRAVIHVCPSDHILVITGGTETEVDGRKYGFRLQKGGWTAIIPFLQNVRSIDLTITPINVRIDGVNSANGINVGADATACVCIDDENETLLYSAVQQLLGKSRDQIQEQIQQTMIGNFRAALNKTTPLQAIGMVESAEGVDDVELASLAGKTIGTTPVHASTVASSTIDAALAQKISDTEGERAIFRSVLLEDCQEDLSTFGIDVVSVSLQRIWDTSNYIANLANKTLSEKRKDVEVEEARLEARAARVESDAQRRMQVAESQASERIVAARQDVELYRRQCNADIQRARLEADSAIAEAESQGQRKVEELRVELQRLRNQSDVTLPAGAQRQAAELIAGGEADAVDITQAAVNDLLQHRVDLVRTHGDIGKLVLIYNKLPALFAAYQEHAKSQSVGQLLVLNEEDGFTEAVNRGPAAMVSFLQELDAGFGVSLRDLLRSEPGTQTTNGAEA